VIYHAEYIEVFWEMGCLITGMRDWKVMTQALRND